jgi:hypothetical protein
MRLFVALLCANWMLLPVPSLADGWGAASMTRVVDDGPLPGASIRWETVKENQVKKALKECTRQKKPALVYFHQDSCAACTRLWNAIMQSARIAKDAKRFVMIKVVQGDAPPSRKEPNALGTRPDGGYTPRVLFYNASGVFQPKIYNAIGTSHLALAHLDHFGRYFSWPHCLGRAQEMRISSIFTTPRTSCWRACGKCFRYPSVPRYIPE